MMYIDYKPFITKSPEKTIDVCSSETGEVFCCFDADKVDMETVITMLYKVGVTEMKISGNAVYVNRDMNDVFWFADNAITIV